MTFYMGLAIAIALLGATIMVARSPASALAIIKAPRIQVRSATLLHSSSHAHLFEYDGWQLKA